MKNPVWSENSELVTWNGLLAKQIARVEYQLNQIPVDPLALEKAKFEFALLQRILNKLR